MFALGVWLRERYVDTGFVSSAFDENQVYFESTTSNRTLMSAYSLLQGFYPTGPEVPNVTPDHFLPPVDGVVQPDIGMNALPNKIALIPIHTKDEEKDLSLALYCPKGSEFQASNRQSEEFK